jgi:uncharacterized protein YqeY
VDLAENETAEADFLVTFLPPQKTIAEIDDTLRVLLDTHAGDVPLDKARVGKTTGLVIKSFREQVDAAQVDMDVVAARLKALIEAKSAAQS